MATATHQRRRIGSPLPVISGLSLPLGLPPMMRTIPLSRRIMTSSRNTTSFQPACRRTLGGGGASHTELCEFLRELAQSCGSTALALSMHMHLLAATVWRWRQGHPVEPLLKRIVQEQTVLISSGGSDWLDSSGTAEKVDGGYCITARKIFSSGCPKGDLLMTTAVYDDPQDGPTVLHFPVPFADERVTITDTWHTLGMRGTGSHDVMIEGVFVPDSAVALRRPKGQWHPFFNVVASGGVPTRDGRLCRGC